METFQIAKPRAAWFWINTPKLFNLSFFYKLCVVYCFIDISSNWNPKQIRLGESACHLSNQVAFKTAILVGNDSHDDCRWRAECKYTDQGLSTEAPQYWCLLSCTGNNKSWISFEGSKYYSICFFQKKFTIYYLRFTVHVVQPSHMTSWCAVSKARHLWRI